MADTGQQRRSVGRWGACSAPVRSRQGQMSSVAWGLYALSVVAVVGRFASRATALGGVGYGWDDWVILTTEGIMTAIMVLFILSKILDDEGRYISC